MKFGGWSAVLECGGKQFEHLLLEGTPNKTNYNRTINPLRLIYHGRKRSPDLFFLVSEIPAAES